MPIYEYACGKCSHEFEVEQRITDDPIKTCPECRSRKVKKLISQTSFVLKGGGWYSDLYSSADAKKKDAKDAKDGKDGKDAKDGASTDKPDKADTSEKKDSTPKPAGGDKPSAKGKSKSKKAAA